MKIVKNSLLKENHAGTFVGFTRTLTIVLAALKLDGVIAWPWIFVVAPLWAPPVFLAAFVVLAVIWAVSCASVCTLFRCLAGKKNR